MDNAVIEAIRHRRSVRAYKSEQISSEELNTILEAATWAPSGHGKQDSLIVAVQDEELCKQLRRMNAEVMGVITDPYYGAPTIVLVFSDFNNADQDNWVKDGSLVIGTMMLAAESVGVGSCWINRCTEMFRTEEGKALKARLGVPDHYEGVGSVALGYAATTPKMPAARKPGYIRIV